ncbi:MAG: FtsX-like permease family protein [Candidatus Bathyarchaeia archaeon]
MNAKQTSLSIILLCIILTILPAQSADVTQQVETVPVYLTIQVRDYNSGIAVANLSVVIDVFTDWGYRRISNRTNETGIVQMLLGTIPKTTVPGRMILANVDLSENYTLIKVQNVFVEEIQATRFEQDYNANHTIYSGIGISLSSRVLDSKQYIEGTLWVLKGKLVKVLDCDILSGTNQELIVLPAIVTDIPSNTTYERLYFFPINYKVTIFHETRSWSNIETEKLEINDPVSPMVVEVNENTTQINWMHHQATEYIERAIYRMDREFEFFNSTGYPLSKELGEYNAIKSLWNRVLELSEKGEYASAYGGAKISNSKFLDLMKWLFDNKITAVFTAIGISLFAYGLGSLLSSFIFDEPSRNKARLLTKVLIFSLVMVLFSLSHPSLKIAFALLIGSRSVSLPLSLLGCFVIGTITYFVMQILSIRQKTMTDLALQLGVRSLKRRKSRTLLTLLTIVIIVSSAIVFVNISLSRETKFVEQWAGTNIPGVIVKPDTVIAPITEYDVNWTRQQPWCKEITYIETVREQERLTTENLLIRQGFISSGEERHSVEIICIDPAFMEKHYNLSRRITGFWNQFIKGEPVIIVPSDFNFLINQDVSLIVSEGIAGQIGPPRQRIIGEFRIIGKFDPQTAFHDLHKIDNTPLFENPSSTILVPLKSIHSSAFTISEVFIIVKEGYEPVDVAQELAYTLASTTIANTNNLSQKIVWSTEFSITGLIPYIPPLIIAGLMMYTTMASVYEERRREFSTLATLGLDPKNTLQVFLVEALLLGLMGTFIGFFGSYLLGEGLTFLSNIMATPGVDQVSIPPAHWSMPSILVALLTGVVMVFLGGYIPALRARGISLMGREQKREMVGELITSGGITTLALPIRESVQNGEMLYTYLKETIGKFKTSLVDPHTVKGELYRDGTFVVSFVALADTSRVTMPCEIKGVREGDVLVPVIQFPVSFRSYERIRQMVRDLEQFMIGFSAWKEMQLKMTIIREAPRKVKTLEEIMVEIKDIVNQIKESSKKLRILDGQKGKLSDEIYNEFREKYINMIEEKSKNIRTMTINLEPHHKQIHEEIGKIEVEVERITTSYNLGEITEEEYVKTCGPLQARLSELRNKDKEMEEIFEFLKKPLGMEYT